MMRKPEYYQKIDMFLNNELDNDELKEFNVELLINSSLSEDVEFHREVQEAVQEQDIMALRRNMELILTEEKPAGESFRKAVISEHISYNFGLSGEFASFKEFFKPVEASDLNRLSHSLPRIHLFQHGLTEKENIHQFYKEQFRDSENDEELLSPADEAIFAEVKDALEEKDIFELRASLGQIATRLPEHQRSTEEIDKYLNQNMMPEEIAEFDEEASYNQRLREDIELHGEVESAVLETDIMALRAALEEIQDSEHSQTEHIEKIDRYLTKELDKEDLILFEEELSSNPLLAEEVVMYREIDSALEETDIMKMRSALQTIGKEVVKDRQRAIRMPLSKIAVASVAACLAVMLSVGGWISRQTSSDTKIYTKYYQPYQSTGIVRSGNTTMDNTLTEALQKFNAQEYESALALFQQVIAYDIKNPVGHFYSGVSYQETGRFNKAIEEYETVVKDRDNLFVEQAEWYIGLCYLQTQERKKAYRQLERISKSSSYYSKKADAIIRRLKLLE